MKIAPLAILLPVFALLLPLESLRAAPLNLYLGAVPVENQSASERSRAMPLALIQVLQKLTGLQDLSGYPDLEASVQDAQNMAITFYYDQKVTVLPDGSPGEQLRMMADFSPPEVDRLIQAMQLPIWKPERQPLTIWLVIDDGLSRQIMPIEFEYVWEKLADVAEARGMPITRPQPDAEGNYPVDPQLLWGGYTEDLAVTGEANNLLIAARREGPEWNVRMNLDYVGEDLFWRNRALDIEEALIEGLDTAISEISAANSIAAADQGHWSYEITINGVMAEGDYIRCLAYLQGQSLVDQVRVSGAGPGWVRFVLSLNALPEYFVRALTSDGVLTALAARDEYSLLR